MAVLINQVSRELTTLPPEVSSLVKKIKVKEILQSYVLDFLYNHPSYRELSFYGGTCARVIYGLDRMSEDLDLDNSEDVDLSRLVEELQDYFRGRLRVEHAEVKTQGVSGTGITRYTLKLPILSQLNLSALDMEKIHVKLEVSQHPQHAVTQVTPAVRHSRSFVVKHFTQESLFAGKIIACLQRVFRKGAGPGVKGRDYYDLIWYMQQQVTPEKEMLQHDANRPYTIESAMRALEKQVAQLSRADLSADLINLFDTRSYIETWLDSFHDCFHRYKLFYLE